MTTLLEKRLPIIRQHAGKIPGTEIAAMLGITTGHLSVICSQHQIKLKIEGSGDTPAAETAPKKRAIKSPKEGRRTSKQIAIETPAETIDKIRSIAGTMPAEAVRKVVNLSKSTLITACANHNISLRYTPPPKPIGQVRATLLQHIDEIREKAGKVRCAEIAASIGVEPDQLLRFCIKEKIKLRMPGQTLPFTQEEHSAEKLEDYSMILRRHGWTVLRPDPFRTLIDEPKRAQKQRKGTANAH